MSTFGERLRMARERTGWNQKEAAARFGITDKSLSRYECDATFPSFDVLKEFVRVYDVSSDYLLGYSDSMGHAPVESSPETDHPIGVYGKLEGLSSADRKKAEEYIDMLAALSEVKNGPVVDLPKRA